ncbi:TPA: polyribonucleotide nucleotidyltransferase [Candidatus Poribacteria bacterium]|nr:polyribonucleotide nucleotidyltransferase [Candidatus Poribacteria bacterium]
MKVEMQLGNEKLSIETGRVAKQADGAAWIQYGGTVVLITAVADKKMGDEELDFLPLTVDYRERGYAAGRIPGIYGRREPRPGVTETLIARLIDHCLRPLFPKEFHYEIQVLAVTLSSDKENPPDTLAMIGASTALCLSDIPFNGPVGAVIVGRINGEFIVNPTYEQVEESDMELFVTGTSSAVMTVEGSAKEIPEDEIIDAIEFAHAHIKEIIKLQEELIQVCGKSKREYQVKVTDERLDARTRELATHRIRESIGMADKQDRETYLVSIQEEILDELAEEGESSEDYISDTVAILTAIEKEEMRKAILDEGKRVDGRGPSDLREITGEVSVLPRTHGSAIFTRGQTQSLCVVTLGTSADEEVVKDLEGESMKPFILHYNFPPFCTGEVRPMRAPSRREIGHGALAEKALLAVMPDKETFPYTVRVVSEILESNASSSMATVCAATLALMDAGVSIKSPVAGVGVGLIKEDDREVILTDMLGTEDFLGDMDFKVAGTRQGVTAVQMDIKIEGVTTELMRKAINQARSARLIVLDKMAEVISEPRDDISPYAPRIYKIHINPEKIGDVIGPRGRVVREIQDEADVVIDISDDGTVEIAADNAQKAERAKELVMAIAQEAEIGKEYKGKVKRVTPFGAFIELFPGTEGMVHISNLGSTHIRRVEDVLHQGDEVTAKVIGIDEYGKIDLSVGDRRRTSSERRSRSGNRNNRDRDRNERRRRSPRIPKGRM